MITRKKMKYLLTNITLEKADYLHKYFDLNLIMHNNEIYIEIA